MRPIDVIHIFEDVGNVKWDDTYSLAESLLVKVFVRSTYDFPFFGWGCTLSVSLWSGIPNWLFTNYITHLQLFTLPGTVYKK